MPDNNTRWIIGTTITVAIALSAQMAFMISMISDLREDTNQRFNQMEQRFNRIEQRLDGFDERLRAVEISFAKVDQRLLILERTLIPAPPGAPN